MTRMAQALAAEALGQALADLSHRQVAAVVGCDHSTVGRRGTDLHLWSAADLIALARHLPAFRRDLQAALESTAGQGNPLLAEGEARAAVGEMGELIAAAMARLHDGRLDATERKATAADLRALAEKLMAHAVIIDARSA